MSKYLQRCPQIINIRIFTEVTTNKSFQNTVFFCIKVLKIHQYYKTFIDYTKMSEIVLKMSCHFIFNFSGHRIYFFHLFRTQNIRQKNYNASLFQITQIKQRQCFITLNNKSIQKLQKRYLIKLFLFFTYSYGLFDIL